MSETYVFDPKVRVFVISRGASLGYASLPGLGDIPYAGIVDLTEHDYTATIIHNLGISGLGILVSFNWPSAAWIVAQSADDFTIGFTVPVAPGGKMVWEVSDIMPVDQVTTDALTHVISHYRGVDDVGLFFTPNWPTIVWDSTSDRTTDTATVYFSQPAPANATLTWRAVD